MHSDLWIADSSCLTNCDSIPTFNPSSSSTFISQNTTFSITYGSGNAAGSLGQDIVQMAGFSVNNQVFATCDTVSQGLLNEPVSGLLGLAFSTISSAGVVPFWETLVTGGAWDAPVMAFQLTRYVPCLHAVPLIHILVDSSTMITQTSRNLEALSLWVRHIHLLLIIYSLPLV